MKTKPISIFLIIICTIFTSSAAIFNKKGAMAFDLSLKGTIFNFYLMLGLLLLALGSVLLMASLKWGDVSVVYPIIATSYVWVTLLSYYVFHDVINMHKLIGIGAIIIGVIMINLGSSDYIVKKVCGFFGVKHHGD